MTKGVVHLMHRMTAVWLTLALALTSCLAPAYAANIWESTIFQILWTDRYGEMQTVQAQPVASMPELTWWAQMPAEALGREVTLQVVSPDSRYSFFLQDEWGGPVTTFTWLAEMDAMSLEYEFAHNVFYTVDGVNGDRPIYLYLSSAEMPREEEFVSFPVQVPVYYMTEDGQTLDMQYAECWADDVTTIRASSDNTQGYVLTGADTVRVSVDREGYATPGEVYFTYRAAATPTPDPTEEPTPEPTEVPTPTPVAEVPVLILYYLGNEQVDYEERFLTPGTHTIWPESSRMSAYELVSDGPVQITVYPDGTADLGSVVFRYQEKQPEATPVTVAVTVNYIHVDRGLLDSQTITLGEGTHIVEANSSKVAGYLPLGSTWTEVAVYHDGTTHPGVVEFYYEDAYVAPVTAELTILYQFMDGTTVARDVQQLTPGSHTIQADASRTSGYALAGEQSQVVTVDENGRISPDTIAFMVEQKAAVVTVHYQDERGRDVAPNQVHTFTVDGVYAINAQPENLPDNYEAVPGLNTQVNVVVTGGNASQSDVYFYYQQKQAAPEMAYVTVHYYDEQGNEIVSAQTVALAPGEHVLTPDATRIPRGYELITDAAVRVNVYENGTFSPQTIAFYYRNTQAQTATVTVYFRDDRGNDVATAQTVKLGNGTHIIEAKPVDLLPGYELFLGMDGTAEVKVANGVPTPSKVVFYYQKNVVEQVEYALPVFYKDTNGNIIADTQYVNVKAGNSYSVMPSPENLPAGSVLVTEAPLPFTVHADGTTDPAELVFYYQVNQKMATVTISYADDQGRAIIEPFTVDLAPGAYIIQGDADRLPSGYDLSSAKGVQVNVSDNGEATPSRVILYFNRQVEETPIPVGEKVNRYAVVKSSDVAFRNEPTTSGGNKTVIKRLSKNSRVFVLEEMYNGKNEVWAMVNVDGRIGYMMSSYLDIMTQQQSDEHAAAYTPVPTFTPEPSYTEVPTPTPTQAPTATPTLLPDPTATPTLEPLPSPSASPTATASPEPYVGYALTIRATALRTGISNSDGTIIMHLEANELVQVINQVMDPMSGEVWAIVSTLGNQPGFVQYSDLREVTEREAEPYIEYWTEINKTPEPTQLVTATPEPAQVSGYAIVIGDGVPFRQMESEYSRIIDHLDAGTIVYVTGQTPGDGQYWHSVNYQGYWGYIRTDLIRMMTIAEEEAYIESQRSTPTPATTNVPFNEHGMSSYGYVDGSSVNWREKPSTSGKRIGELKRYAFCLVLSSEYVDGVTWYHVSYGDKTGYVHGDFFKQMTIAELESFLGSDEYLQGISNNSPSGDTSMDDVGFTGTGGIVSAEDKWVNNNPDVYASFAPFNPIATVAPIATASPTLEPLPGWYTDGPTNVPTPTPTFNPLPDVTYPTNDQGEGGASILWALVIGLLLLAVGGVFALVRYNQNRRRIAMRAAQRRAQAARAQQQRPYARTAAPGQPRTGMYQQQMHPTEQNSPYGSYGSYAGGSFRPHAAEETEADAPVSTQRVGRRTAYRQAQEAARQQDDNLDM